INVIRCQLGVRQILTLLFLFLDFMNYKQIINVFQRCIFFPQNICFGI
ncbi:hypothetical protein X975_23779, partial [Stegodyphus mimosarum]